jgi:hypothetical protein
LLYVNWNLQYIQNALEERKIYNTCALSKTSSSLEFLNVEIRMKHLRLYNVHTIFNNRSPSCSKKGKNYWTPENIGIDSTFYYHEIQDWNYLDDSVTNIQVHKTSLILPLFIEVPVPSQESKRSCICVLGISNLPISAIFLHISSELSIKEKKIIY